MLRQRYLSNQLILRLKERSPLIQVVLGPRQVGKTTAVKNVLSGGGVYESADSPTPLDATLIQDWWKVAEKDPTKTLAIDEVQKIVGWSEMVKKLWDRSKGVKVILTGSSAILVEKGLTETLVGRYELIRAEHWNFAEGRDVFGLTLRDFIEFGCYPGAVQFLGDKERWGYYVRDSIVEPVIGRDLLQLHPVDQPSLLRQAFGVAVSLPAQIVSLHKFQGALAGKGTLPTLKHYIHLLGEAFLISGIEKYSGVPIRQKSSAMKMIIHDNALMRAFERPITSPLSHERFGRYFENAVGARFIESGWDTYYWKDRDLEVDFVVVGPQGEKWAIEIKTGEIEEKDLRGLREFVKRNPSFKPCLVSMVKQEFSGIMALPAEEVLSLRR